MNGPRMNQFVAPTSFITSISRRREKIESRIVFAMSSVDAITRRITATRKTSEITFPIVSTRFVIELAHVTPPTSPSCLPGRARLDAGIVGATDPLADERRVLRRGRRHDPGVRQWILGEQAVRAGELGPGCPS